ncbi:hypothetical protein Rctr85_091 [Virus Rctr85]|nr:hypothetical protein Rctr85_091 [Virus Rctr85]
MRQYRRDWDVDLAKQIQFTEGSEVKYLDFPMLSGDHVIISDIEMPDQFELILRLALYVGMARDIKSLLIAGDAIATDQAALNTWVTTWMLGDQTYEEVADGSLIPNLNALSRWYTNVTALEANHDIRVAKATKGQLHLGMLLKYSTDVQYSRYEYAYIETPRGFVRVIHPRNFAQDPAVLGQQLYAVEQGPHYDPLDPFGTFQKCHIVLGHCHRQQAAMSPDGVYEVHTLGTLRHPHKVQYLNKSVAKFKKWDTGFLVNQRGFFYPMKLNGTDWLRELGGYDGFYSLVADELDALRRAPQRSAS